MQCWQNPYEYILMLQESNLQHKNDSINTSVGGLQKERQSITQSVTKIYKKKTTQKNINHR